MKCAIIYLSITGNTELIARTIQEGVKQAPGKCDISPLKKARSITLNDYDLIGFGCPPMKDHVETPGFARFINELEGLSGKHAFVFCTHGTHPEFIFPSMVSKIIARGMIVIGAYSCYAPCYLSIMPWPYITAGHPDAVDLKAASDFGIEMVKRSLRIKAGEVDLIPSVPQPPVVDPQIERDNAARMKKMVEQGKQPYHSSFQSLRTYHAEKCNYPKCRLCVDHCPEEAIDLSVQPPSIGRGCIGCTFCAKICPTGAMDESAWTAASAPMITEMMKSFYLEGSVKSESEGRFRRLIRIEDIGFNTPVYRVFQKHPQWIIGKGLNK